MYISTWTRFWMILSLVLKNCPFPPTNSLRVPRSPEGVPDSEIFGRVLRTILISNSVCHVYPQSPWTPTDPAPVLLSGLHCPTSQSSNAKWVNRQQKWTQKVPKIRSDRLRAVIDCKNENSNFEDRVKGSAEYPSMRKTRGPRVDWNETFNEPGCIDSYILYRKMLQNVWLRRNWSIKTEKKLTWPLLWL